MRGGSGRGKRCGGDQRDKGEGGRLDITGSVWKSRALIGLRLDVEVLTAVGWLVLVAGM